MLEMKRTDKAIAGVLALGAVLALALAFAAPGKAASYGNGFQVAKFKVELDGYSNTTWHRNVEAADECSTSDHSFGRERLKFTATKPIYVTATHMKGEFNPLLFASNAKLGIPVKATIQRSFTPAIAGPEKVCEENGGGAEATPPDCGTRQVKPWLVEMEFSEKKRDGLQLHSNTNVKIPYENCPGAGFTFPFLLDEQGTREHRKPLYADLSQDELFDPKFQKWITIGDGTFKEADDTWFAKTDVHWALSFTRLGGKKR
jgi:hypothetical protein